MAPKRQAPPPPPPPAASDDETASGSGSEEESEEEEEIAHSPPSATTPKPRAPPPQKGQESEGSDDEEEDGEEEEEEEEDKTNHVAPPPATKNPSPPPPPNREESESSGDEEGEETDDEAPHPKPAPNQEAEEGKGAKPSASEDKQPGAPFQRTWSTDDEVRILEALAAHRREHGTLPQIDALAASLAGSLDYRGCSSSVLQGKVRNLRRRYVVAGKKRELPSKDHDRRLFDLSKIVWPPTAANDGARREVGEVCERYPYLAGEVRAVEKAYPGLFKREFEMMDDDKACALDEKIKRQRLHQARLHQKHSDLIKEVTRTLIDLTE